jgi:hypothetical protein
MDVSVDGKVAEYCGYVDIELDNWINDRCVDCTWIWIFGFFFSELVLYFLIEQNSKQSSIVINRTRYFFGILQYYPRNVLLGSMIMDIRFLEVLESLYSSKFCLDLVQVLRKNIYP